MKIYENHRRIFHVSHPRCRDSKCFAEGKSKHEIKRQHQCAGQKNIKDGKRAMIENQ